MQSMESQQTRLIKALQKVHRHVRQTIDEDDMNEIVDIVRACGFDFEGISDVSDKSKPILIDRILAKDIKISIETALQSGRSKDMIGGGLPNHAHAGSEKSKKRGRAEDVPRAQSHALHSSSLCEADLSGVTGSTANEYFLLDDESPTPSPKKQKPSTPALMTDDYWNLGHYLDHIASPYITYEPNVSISGQPFAQGSETSMQQAQTFDYDWLSDGHAQMPNKSTNCNAHPSIACPDDTYDIDCSTASAGLSASAFLTFPEPDSTLWWDPSALFDMDGVGADLVVGDCALPISEQIHDPTNGHS